MENLGKLMERMLSYWTANLPRTSLKYLREGTFGDHLLKTATADMMMVHSMGIHDTMRECLWQDMMSAGSLNIFPTATEKADRATQTEIKMILKQYRLGEIVWSALKKANLGYSWTPEIPLTFEEEQEEAETPPPRPRKRLLEVSEEVEKEASAALAALDDIDFSDVGSIKTDQKPVDSSDDNLGETVDFDKLSELVKVAGDEISALEKAGYNDFNSVVRVIANKNPDKYEKMKPVLRGVWNAVADAKNLEDVSRKTADEIYAKFDNEIEKVSNEKVYEAISDIMRMAVDHWVEYRPQMTLKLLQQGKLGEKVLDASRRTQEQVFRVPPAERDIIWEMIRENAILLREEDIVEDEPEKAAEIRKQISDLIDEQYPYNEEKSRVNNALQVAGWTLERLGIRADWKPGDPDWLNK